MEILDKYSLSQNNASRYLEPFLTWYHLHESLSIVWFFFCDFGQILGKFGEIRAFFATLINQEDFGDFGQFYIFSSGNFDGYGWFLGIFWRSGHSLHSRPSSTGDEKWLRTLYIVLKVYFRGHLHNWGIIQMNFRTYHKHLLEMDRIKWSHWFQKDSSILVTFSQLQ